MLAAEYSERSCYARSLQNCRYKSLDALLKVLPQLLQHQFIQWQWGIFLKTLLCKKNLLYTTVDLQNEVQSTRLLK
jgi:hypothetical protein